jgi:hypothetical protein
MKLPSKAKQIKIMPSHYINLWLPSLKPTINIRNSLFSQAVITTHFGQ